MTAAVGDACLAVGLGAALYAVGAGVYGARSGRREFVTSARWAMYCLAGLLTTAVVMLVMACIGIYAILTAVGPPDGPLF